MVRARGAAHPLAAGGLHRQHIPLGELLSPRRLVARRVPERVCICGEIVGELDLAQSTVSQHLKVMKAAGLIQGEVDGPRICYCLSPRTLRRFKALVGGL